uniref:Solute carrier family 43 member 3 n=1 Tax=Schistosoma mansoni TaxID=6183 RepID=A0A5K4EW37_SCHMA
MQRKERAQLDNCFPSSIRRHVGLILGILDLFFFGGYHYGFNSLIGIYKSLGLFAYNCTQSGCMYKEDMFGISFNVWFVSQMCLITLAGIFMDRVGLRPLKLASTLMYAAGTLMFAFTTGKVAPLFFTAGILVALSSICSLICNHQISSMFPHFRGICISLISGAFDSSTVVAYVISKYHPYFSLQWSFISLSIGSFIMGLFMAMFIFTMKSVDMAKFAKMEVKESVFQSRESCLEESSSVDVDKELSNVIDERFPTLRKCIFSASYALINLWLILGLFRFAIFLSQLYRQLFHLFPTDEKLVEHLLEVSSVFSMCGFFAAPISGVIIDLSLRRSRDKVANMLISNKFNVSNREMYYNYICGLVPALTIMGIFAVILSAMMFIANTVAIYTAFVCLVIVRSIMFSAFVSYLLTGFPIRYFGTLNGISSAMAGLFSLLQHIFLHTSGTTANSVSMAASVSLFITPFALLMLRR